MIEIPLLAALFRIIFRQKRDCENSIGFCRDALAEFKLHVARNYVSVNYLKDVENRLTDHLLRIEKKLDGVGEAKPMNRDTDILARTIYGEARGESISGQEAIASVILNRVAFAKRRGRYWWGNTIAGVCLAPWQFSCWNENDLNRKIIERADDADIGFCICKRIALRAASGLWKTGLRAQRITIPAACGQNGRSAKFPVPKSAVISFITTLRHKMRVLMKSFFLPLRLLRRLSRTLRAEKAGLFLVRRFMAGPCPRPC